MSVIEILSLLTSSGVCAGGLGILKWAINVEKRVMRLELKNGIE